MSIGQDATQSKDPVFASDAIDTNNAWPDYAGGSDSAAIFVIPDEFDIDNPQEDGTQFSFVCAENPTVPTTGNTICDSGTSVDGPVTYANRQTLDCRFVAGYFRDTLGWSEDSTHQIDCRIYDGDEAAYSAVTASKSLKLLTRPITTEFSSTTDLGANNPEDLSQWSLQNSQAKMTWDGANIDVTGENYDDAFVTFQGGVAGDDTGLSVQPVGTAELELYHYPFGTLCDDLRITKSEAADETTTDVHAIYGAVDAAECNDCTFISCGGGIFKFDVTGFSGYAAGANDELAIWDQLETDGSPYSGLSRPTGQQIEFYANYTNITNGSIITNADCYVSFDDLVFVNVSMSYNATKTLFEFNRTFSQPNTYDWNVTCNAPGFVLLDTNDTITVNAPGIIPEYSYKTFLLAFAVALFGFMALRGTGKKES
jgi:hypothetical protein